MALHKQKVTKVHHWTDKTFSFQVERPASFRFRSGEFVTIGLEVNGKPLLRAYSIASPAWEDHLEFLSIKIEDGPLTSKLQHIQPGDEVVFTSKAVGTLLPENLNGNRNLYLMATGTGLAPFMSIAFDPAVYEQFDKVILVHTVRYTAEHAYREELSSLTKHPVLGELTEGKFVYYPTVTREMPEDGFARSGRGTDLFSRGEIYKDLELQEFDGTVDGAMICGSTEFNQDCIDLFESLGGTGGNANKPGSYVYEKAFVTK